MDSTHEDRSADTSLRTLTPHLRLEQQHFEELFHSLKISYLEEETRERYLRILYNTDVLFQPIRHDDLGKPYL